MLIRYHNNELVEYPDDLIVLMLASPLHGDLDDESDWSIKELNCLIHAMLGTGCDETLSLEQNIEKIRTIYERFGQPTAANLARAQALVQFYNETLSADEIGYSDKETIRTIFSFQNTAHLIGSGNQVGQDGQTHDAATALAVTSTP